ncbi:MAG: DUF92 domain-containing protein [Spirochaetales bacterium]|nr:DUF92 domain-containing protein [Spirochaetales bacterium]
MNTLLFNPPLLPSLTFLYFVTSCLVGVFLSFIFAYPGYLKRSLDFSGLIGALAVGTLIFQTVGLGGFIPLILFFASSSILSGVGKKRKASINKKNSEGSRRNIRQVLANSGPALIAFILYGITGHIGFLTAGTAALSGAAADTWASEGGVLFDAPTYLVLGLKPVEQGASGGVSIPGTLLSLGGAFFVSLVSLFLLPYPDSINPFFILIMTTLLGFFCSVLDSILGASVQGIYLFKGKHTERVFDPTGRRNEKIRGYSSINNSGVNFISGFTVLIIAIIIFLNLL